MQIGLKIINNFFCPVCFLEKTFFLFQNGRFWTNLFNIKLNDKKYLVQKVQQEFPQSNITSWTANGRKSNILDKIRSFLIKEILSFIISAKERRQILNNFSCSFISDSTGDFFPGAGRFSKTFGGISTAQRTSWNFFEGTLGAKFFNNSPKPHWNLLLNAQNYFKLSIFNFRVIFAENPFASRVVYGESWKFCLPWNCSSEMSESSAKDKLLALIKFSVNSIFSFITSSFLRALWSFRSRKRGASERREVTGEHTRDGTLVSLYFNYEKINIKL